MNDEHHPERCPTIREIAGMLGEGLGEGDWRRMTERGRRLLEWLEGCSICRERLAILERWQDEVGFPDPLVVVEERNRARSLWRELERLPDDRLKEHLGERHFFWAMCSLLLDRSQQATAYSHRRAVRLAEAAASITVFLDPDHYSRVLLADLRARCWAVLGNAQRVAGDLEAAARSFTDALSFLESGTRSPWIRATVADLLGSLRVDQRRLPEATATLRLAAALYEEIGCSELVGKVHLLLGNVADLAGDTAQAIVHLTRAQRLLSESHNVFLFAHCQHNLLHYLIKAGQHEEAELRIPMVQRLWKRLGHSRNLIKLRWSEGHICRRRGDLESALSIYREVSTRFEKERCPYELALVQLDLAEVLATSRRFDELAQVAKSAYELLRARGARAEALRALTLIRRAAIGRTATAAMVRAAAELLATTPENPTAELIFA